MALLPPVVASLTADISEFQAKMAEAQGTMDETETSGEASMGGLAAFGKVALLAVAAGVVAVGAAALDLGAKYQDSTNALAASANISVNAAQKIGNAFLSQAFSTTFSAQETITAYQGVAAQLGQVAGHALTSAQALAFMKQAQDLAEASGISLSSATSAVSSILQTYSLGLSQAASVSNVLYNASRLTGTGADTLTASLTKLRAGLGAVTPPIGQVGGLLVDLASHGETGRKGLSAVTSGLTSMLTATEGVTKAQEDAKAAFDEMPPSLQALATAYQNGTITSLGFTTATEGLSGPQAALVSEFSSAQTAIQSAQTKLAAMGITVDSSSGKFVGMASVIGQLHDKIQGMTQAQALATIGQVFGATSASKLYATIEAGSGAYDKDTEAVTKSNSAHEAAEKNAASLKGQVETLTHGFEDLITVLGTKLVPIFTDVVHGADQLAEFFIKNKTAALALGIGLGSVLTVAIGAYAVAQAGALAATVASAGGLVPWIASMWSAAAAEAAAAAPIILIVGGIALLVAGFILAYTHITVFRDIVNTVAGILAGVFSTAFNVAKTAIGWVIGAFVTLVSNGAGVVSFFVSLPGKITGALADAGTWLLNIGKSIVTGLINGIEGAVGDAVNAVKKVGSSIINAAKSVLSIFSPSAVFAGMGANVVAGLAQGIAGSTSSAVAATTAMTNRVVQAGKIGAQSLSSQIAPMSLGAAGSAAATSASAAGQAQRAPVNLNISIPVTGDMSPQTANYITQQLKQFQDQIVTALNAA